MGCRSGPVLVSLTDSTDGDEPLVSEWLYELMGSYWSKVYWLPCFIEIRVNPMSRFRAFTDSDFSATHTLTASALRPHFHSGYVVGYLFSGRYHCRLSHTQYLEFRPGEITLLNPGDVHQDFSTRQERDYLTVNIQERLFTLGLQDFNAPSKALPSFFPSKDPS